MPSGFPLGGAAAGNRPISDRDRAIFVREWERGTPMKTIGAMLDPPRTAAALRSWRFAMGLPRRRKAKDDTGGKRRVESITIELTKSWKEAVLERAAAERLSVSRYLRRLIEADIAQASRRNAA